MSEYDGRSLLPGISVWPFSFDDDLALVEGQEVQDHRQMKRANPMEEMSLHQMRILL